jgi:hypothetical protein
MSAGVILAFQWYYQPSVETSITASLVSVLLLVVVTWSAHRLGSGLSGLVKTGLVGLVSGLMFSQAMDVSYSLLAAPAGGRLGFPLEMIAVGLGLAVLAKLLALAIRSKKEEQSGSDEAERAPE